jgi:hypothetical protein
MYSYSYNFIKDYLTLKKKTKWDIDIDTQQCTLHLAPFHVRLDPHPLSLELAI